MIPYNKILKPNDILVSVKPIWVQDIFVLPGGRFRLVDEVEARGTRRVRIGFALTEHAVVFAEMTPQEVFNNFQLPDNPEDRPLTRYDLAKEVQKGN